MAYALCYAYLPVNTTSDDNDAHDSMHLQTYQLTPVHPTCIVYILAHDGVFSSTEQQLLACHILQDTITDKDIPATNPTNYTLDCPPEFRSILQSFSASDLHKEYPLVHVHNRPLTREYLPASFFFHRYTGYRFAWLIEDDVRYTGAHWGIMLNTLLHASAGALLDVNITEFHTGLGMCPNKSVQPPDLVILGHRYAGDEVLEAALVTPESRIRDASQFHLRYFKKANSVFFGISNLYQKLLHHHSVHGNAAYVEDFLLSLALEEKLNVSLVNFADWGGNSISCCGPFGLKYYTNWYIEKDCRYYTLVHPIKNKNESVWGPTLTEF